MTQARQVLIRLKAGDKVSDQAKFDAIKVQLPKITPSMIEKLGGYVVVLDAIQYGPRDLETLYMMYETGFRSKKRIKALIQQLIKRNKLTVSGMKFDQAFKYTLIQQLSNQLNDEMDSSDELTQSQLREDLSPQTPYRVFYNRPELWAMTLDSGYPDDDPDDPDYDDNYIIVYEMKSKNDQLQPMVAAAIEDVIENLTS